MHTPLIAFASLLSLASLGATGCNGVDSASASAPELIEETFDKRSVGPLHLMRSAIGDWTADADHAEILDHPKTGERCLRLLGGSDRAVTLDVTGVDDDLDVLSFRAERWTARGPFAFRVDVRVGDRWQNVYTGDADVRVGEAFLSRVRARLPKGPVDAIRFVSTAPDGGGVLIDDVRLSIAQPVRVAEVATVKSQTPLLVGAPTNDLLGVRVVVTGDEGAISVRSIAIELSDAGAIEEIEKIEVYVQHGDASLDGPGPDGLFAGMTQLGQPQVPSESLTFEGDAKLEPGVNHLWVSCTLKPTANPDHRIDASCTTIGLSDGSTRTPEAPAIVEGKRIGFALRSAGDDGVRVYRIPGLARTNAGSLIAVYDVRHDSGRDLPGNIDVGMSRSTDGGVTWDPMRVIMDMGDESVRRLAGNGVGDPAVLVDRGTGTIWVAGLWSRGARGWNGSRPGLEPNETGQFLLVRSDDDGQTWSEPINITRQVKDPAWRLMLQGPGSGITMADGTLVFAAQFRDATGLPRSTIIYSADHGKTWRAGTGAYDDTTEAQVAEIEPGVLMLNCRYNRAGRRVVMITRDLGKTWQEHPTSRSALPEPGACMASLIRLNLPGRAGRWLAFSNPHVGSPPRRRLTIQLSPDNGETWPEAHRLLLDEGISAGYSCLTQIDDQTIGILYEGSRSHLTFQRVRIADVLGQRTNRE